MAGQHHSPGEGPGQAPWRDAEGEPLVRIRGVSRRFGSVAAVDGVDLDIYRGELFSILGGSGSGKGSLMDRAKGMFGGRKTEAAGDVHWQAAILAGLNQMPILLLKFINA